MGFCVLGLGDCETRAETSTTIDTSALTSTITNTITRVSQSTTASSMNLNTVKIVVGRDTLPGCDIAVAQSINSTTIASGTLKQGGLTEIKRDITNGINAQIDQASAATSQLGGGQSSATDTTDIKSHVETLLETNITDETYNSALSESLSKNAGELYIGRDCRAKINFDQNIVSQVTAINLLDKVQQILDSDAVVNQFTADVTQAATAKSEGLAGLLKAIFDGLTGIWGIIAVVACVLICGALIFLMSPAGQESSVKLANAGASKIKGPIPLK
jgi:hypothetical protein